MIWLVGAAIVLARLGAGWLRVTRTTIDATPLKCERVWRLVHDCRRRLGVRAMPRVLTSPAVRVLVPLLIVAAFSVYIVAQLKAAGITAQALLGIPYDTALVIATLVFITYVSIGGMIAITLTDVIQGLIMLVVVLVFSGAFRTIYNFAMDPLFSFVHYTVSLGGLW